MDFVNGKDLALCGGLDPSCTVLILHDGVFQRMQLQDVLDYLNGAKVTTDTTLLLKDIPAEAKATGEAIRKAAPRNLLDNSDFTNLFAQAGIGGNHGNQAYAADRWKLTSGTVSYAEGTGLTLNGTISQTLEWIPETASAFVGMASGTATITRSGNTVTIRSSGGVLRWAAIYEGTYTADNMPEYQSKGLAAEELECKRYFGIVDDWSSIQGVIDWENKLALIIPWPVWMRINPTCTVVKGSIIVDGTYVDLDATPSAVVTYSGNLNVRFDATVTGNHTSRPVVVTLGDTPFYFSADL